MRLYMAAHDFAFPLKTNEATNKNKKHSPWITKGLVQSAVTKATLLVKKIKYPTDFNIDKHRKFQILYNKLLRICKKTYFEEQLINAKRDMKATWNILRAALNKTNNSTPIPEYFIINNIKVTNKAEIVKQFNNFFASIGSDMSQNVPSTHAHFSEFLSTPHDRSMFLDPITTEDTINITSKLKPKTAKGPDGISTKLFKQSIHSIAVPLTHIINQSMTTGTVPQDMKIARVIPIFKSWTEVRLPN